MEVKAALGRVTVYLVVTAVLTILGFSTALWFSDTTDGGIGAIYAGFGACAAWSLGCSTRW